MKKYLYSIFLALLFVVGCEPENTYKPDVAFCFGEVNVETTDTTAVVELLAYMTVDGVKYEDAQLYVEYWAGGDSANMKSVTEYVAVGDNGRVAFTINDLKQNKRYYANIVCDGGKEYGADRREFTFATRETIVESITCNATVDAKGILATVSLTDVAYLLNDNAQQIARLMLEYKRKDTDAWTAVEFAGKSVNNGKISIKIPKDGDEYLEEASAYEFFVTLTPQNWELTPLSTEVFSFNTKYADITADISKPQLSYGDEGITIKAGSIDVYYDGVASSDYTSYIYFRKQGSSVWNEYTLSEDNSVVIAAEQFEEGAAYEAKVSIVAGAYNQVRESAVATITTPKSDIPVTPEPPTGGDTSSIAGVWHLTSWRGVTPSFEVYMDITATGGVTLYQRIDSLYWEVYQSAASIVNGVISGVYTDNVAWGASYNLAVAGDSMTWTATNDATDVSIYTRSTLPASMPTAPTRAAISVERFL